MATDPTAQAKANLINAIFAMDSYNRGYGSGLSGLDQPVLDGQGNLTNNILIGNYHRIPVTAYQLPCASQNSGDSISIALCLTRLP